MKRMVVVCGAAALLLASATAQAAKDRQVFRRRAFPLHVEGVDNNQTIGINNIRMFVTNTGSFAWDKVDQGQPAGFEFPKGTGKTAVFAAGLWLGCTINGAIHMVVSEYSDEYQPGSAVGGVPDDPNKNEYKVYKLDRVYSNTADRDAALLDYNTGAVPHGAPVVTANADGLTLDGLLGDEMMWAVYNDLDSLAHNNRADNLLRSLGVEVQQTTFAFAAQGALGNTIFIKFKIINRGPWFLDNMYASQWADPDVGGATDDLVGCDVPRSIGFAYNATNNDAEYGSSPPSVGFDFFKGPLVNGTPLGLASFNKYINGTDPNAASKSYNYMQGLDADGNVVIDPTTGLPTKFVVNGDPVTGSGWLDSNPADRRMMLSTGPFTMAPGDSQEIVVGIVVGQSSSRTCSVALMKFYDESAQAAFDLNFNVPHPPNPPAVKATPQNGGVLLTWDNHAENYSQAGYGFEGYTIYQGSSVAGPWKRVATFDKNDGITTVIDNNFDNDACVVLPKVAAQGTDRGIQYSSLITNDVIGGGPLYNAFPYYYTVRSYSVGVGLVPQVLESADTVHTVVPQTPPGGVDWASATTTQPVQGQFSNLVDPGTDNVKVNIIDPNQMIDASYKLGYKQINPAAPVTWYVVRSIPGQAAVDTVVNDQTDYTGDNSYPVFDGVQAVVSGAPLGLLGRVSYVSAGATPPGLKGEPDIGGAYFDGSADYAAILLPMGSAIDPTDPSKSFQVEMRFTGPLGAAQVPGQKAYRYLRTLDSGGNRVYQYENYVDVPFTVWEVPANRQLNCGFLENAGNPGKPGNVDWSDGRWDPDSLPDFTAQSDDREFVAIYTSDYNAAPQPVYMVDWLDPNVGGGTMDILYGFWPNSTSAPVVAGDKVVFAISKRSPNDFYTFSTSAPNRSNTSMAKSDLNQVLAVPNPYFAHSAYELDQFNRVVKFTHLPAQCTIRLFNLAGDLVRTIQKNDATSMATWDLQTDHGLPVGSGIYVYHVEAPGVGHKIGKLAVFVEKERLNNY